MPTSRRTPLPPRAADPALLPHHGPTPALAAVHRAIVSCERCPRLRRHCQRIAIEKRAAFRDQLYWGRPVPGFGDPAARLLVVGLAPAAHGANRTGRVFTGDGVGGSSDFLLAAMHASGFANKAVSRHVSDGLELRDAFIAAAVRCAPPDNKPTPEEFARCQTHLLAEWDALPNVTAVLCLGRLAWDACWRALAARGHRVPRPRPLFAHGTSVRLDDGLAVLGAYHPSRQNTHTGRLTPAMLAEVFQNCRLTIAD
ncbi:MAG: uracil-DNA glycosylase [Vicinamibacteria bacterium]|nr:uracil-DNA glycosylase [Vicinamibacteria bacterium]